MTNEEYIRKAVEILGWEVTDDSEQCKGFWYFIELINRPDEPPTRKEVHSTWDWACDVIAAELTRQVDALDGPWFNFTRFSSDSFQAALNVDPDYPPAIANGPDRTMNTIKAIVDSGVLENES